VFYDKAIALAEMERPNDAIPLFEELARRFASAPEVGVRGLVADSFTSKAIALEQLGRHRGALAAYDDALAILANATELVLRQQSVAVLFRKGDALRKRRRHAEAVVMFDGAVSAYLEIVAGHGDAREALATAVLALLHKVLSLCALDRSGEAAHVRDRLLAVLGDVSEPAVRAAPAQQHSIAQAELAALLAEVLNGDSWLLLATAGSEPQARQLLAERAIELYRQTEPWLSDEAGENNGAIFCAAMGIRNIADGYAMLSRYTRAPDRAALPLPIRPLMEWGIRLSSTDEWAAELGHPLTLQESPDAARQLLEEERAREDGSGSEFVWVFLAAVTHFEMLAALCASANGRDALQTEGLRDFASWRIGSARRWAASTGRRQQEAAGAAVASQLIAEAYFVASYGEASPCAAPFPSRKVLQDILRSSDADKWLQQQDVDLPAWLVEDGS
jgi:tetratricopeptide (TPR) repeat protein